MKDFTITHIGDTALSLPMPFIFIKAKGETFNFQTHDGTEYGSKNKGTPITFATDFWLCAYQTTQELWRAVVKEAKPKDLEEFPSHFKGKHRPVEQVSWTDIQVFNEAFNKLLAGGKMKFEHDEIPNGIFGLPSETQWEYAANANQALIFAGSQNLNDVAWYNYNCYEQTMPVGLKRPNALGLYDMSGNVYQWCADDYSNDLAEIPKDGTPYLKSGVNKSLRGGCYFNSAQFCRLRDRSNERPKGRNDSSGFRLRFSPSSSDHVGY